MLPAMWRMEQIADVAAAGLRERSSALQFEQAVRGLDAMAEVEFHPLLAAAFEGAGFGVHREFPYPGQPGGRPRHAERERCDLVLTAEPGLAIRDPVAELRTRDAAEGTLFEPLADALAVAPGAGPDEACWLEVKLVGQFCFNAGVPGPNRAYSSEILTLAAADIPKLARDRLIRHAALLLILFTADRETAEHDLAAFAHRCLDKDLPVVSPSIARFGVPDLIGNTVCSVCVMPVRPSAES
jgi:hypothetical protein